MSPQNSISQVGQVRIRILLFTRHAFPAQFGKKLKGVMLGLTVKQNLAQAIEHLRANAKFLKNECNRKIHLEPPLEPMLIVGVIQGNSYLLFITNQKLSVMPGCLTEEMFNGAAQCCDVTAVVELDKGSLDFKCGVVSAEVISDVLYLNSLFVFYYKEPQVLNQMVNRWFQRENSLFCLKTEQ